MDTSIMILGRSGPLLCMASMSPIFYSFQLNVYIIYTPWYCYIFLLYTVDIPYMNINGLTTPAGQLWFVCLILLYVTYNKYFYLTSTMTHFYAYYLRINCKIEIYWWCSSQGRLKNHSKVQFWHDFLLSIYESSWEILLQVIWHSLKVFWLICGGFLELWF